MLLRRRKIQFLLCQKLKQRDSCQNCLWFDAVRLDSGSQDGIRITTFAKTIAIAGAGPAAPAIAGVAASPHTGTDSARGTRAEAESGARGSGRPGD